MSAAQIGPRSARWSSATAATVTSATNTLSVVFTNSPTAGTVSTSSVILGEVSAAGAFTPFDSSKYTVTAASPSATNKSFIIKITDAAYPLKFTQKYGVKLTTAITDSASGQPLKAEGCSASDCSEFRSFTTGTFAPTITITSRTTGAFKVAFNASVDPATLNPYVGSAYKLFKTNKDGSLDSTPIVMSCTPFSTVSPATTTTNCTTTSTLALDYTYVASATFLQTAVAGQSGPAHVAATISGLPTDAPTTTNGSTFFGSRTATFTTPCP